jgi:VanZ family protein
MTSGRPHIVSEQRATPAPYSLPVQLFAYWGTVLGWMTVISTMSSRAFSAENTGRYLDPLLRFFFPHLSAAQFATAHWMVRKTAHFSEFFVLGCLLYWALRRGRQPRWRTAWMMQALALGVLYSLVDEAHQAFVPNRTSSLLDSVIDSLGAASSQVVICIRSFLLARLARRQQGLR